MARILIIDDDDLLRNVLAKTLTHAGHSVVEAADGAQGMDVFHAASVDLVITDLVMPVQEGVETIIALKQERPDLPVIAMSGGVSNAMLYLEIASKVGANKILPKPFTPKELNDAIAEVL
jgi:CheY-like chemotaxis protein